MPSDSYREQTRILEHVAGVIAQLEGTTRLVSDPGELPHPLLMAEVTLAEHDQPQILHVMCLPFDADADFRAMTLIQFYAPLITETAPETRATVDALLTHINSRTTVGYFGVAPSDMLYFRHLLPTSRPGLPDERMLQQLIVLIVYMVDRFTPLLVSTARGETSLSAAVATLDRDALSS